MLRFFGKFFRHFTKFAWAIALTVLSIIAYALLQAIFHSVIRAVRDQNVDFDGMFGSFVSSLRPRDWY